MYDFKDQRFLVFLKHIKIINKMMLVKIMILFSVLISTCFGTEYICSFDKNGTCPQHQYCHREYIKGSFDPFHDKFVDGWSYKYITYYIT
jgi:hypothetical protein